MGKGYTQLHPILSHQSVEKNTCEVQSPDTQAHQETEKKKKIKVKLKKKVKLRMKLQEYKEILLNECQQNDI